MFVVPPLGGIEAATKPQVPFKGTTNGANTFVKQPSQKDHILVPTNSRGTVHASPIRGVVLLGQRFLRAAVLSYQRGLLRSQPSPLGEEPDWVPVSDSYQIIYSIWAGRAGAGAIVTACFSLLVLPSTTESGETS